MESWKHLLQCTDPERAGLPLLGAQLPRGEAAHFFCDIHSLMSSWFETAPPVRHPGFLIPTNLNSGLVSPADGDTPPNRPHRSAPVGRSALNLPSLIIVPPTQPVPAPSQIFYVLPPSAP